MSVNTKRYDINYTKAVTQRIPVPIQKDRTTAWLLVLVTPIVFIYNLLLSFRALIIYKLTITPQVCYLEKMLNDRYDTIDRRIYIADGKEYNPIFIYRKVEVKPAFFFRKSESTALKQILYLKNETGSFTFDFVIHIPVEVLFDQNELVALVRTYKLPAITFKIQIH